MNDGPNPEYPHEDVEHKIGKTTIHISTYYSVAELGARALARATRPNWQDDDQAKRYKDRGKDPAKSKLWDNSLNHTDSWAGGKSIQEMSDMATGDGWSELLTETLSIAENAVSMAEMMHETQSFEPTFDVAGQDVDVDRYLSGEPENMIDYPVAITSKYGKVVTLVSAGCVSSAIEPEDYIRRGQVLAALAIALERLGHSTELWLDIGYSNYENREYHSRILVKGSADAVDPAVIMLAYAHPGMLRKLGFGDCDQLEWSRQWVGRGMPADACRIDMPEEAIYTPSLTSGYARRDTHTELRNYLKLLGLLQGEDDD